MMNGEVAGQRLVAHVIIGAAAREMCKKDAELERTIKEMSWSEFSEFLSILNDDEKSRAMAIRREVTRHEENTYGRKTE